jgi:hypothetical protein
MFECLVNNLAQPNPGECMNKVWRQKAPNTDNNTISELVNNTDSDQNKNASDEITKDFKYSTTSNMSEDVITTVQLQMQGG